MRAFSTVSRSIFGWVSAAVAVAVIAISASVLAAPGKAYADTASHIEATGEIHVLVDGAGNASIPNVTLKNTGSVAAYITGCSAPAELSGWTCDAVGKRIEPGQSVQASWSGQVSAETAAKLGSEAYFAGTLTYSYDDAVLKGTVTIDNQDPYVGDTVTASASGLNVSDDQVAYQWYRVKDGVETAIDDAVQPAYTVVDADAGCTLLCKLFSSDSICTGSVSSDATHEVKRLEAFAVYSADDQSLNFYKRSSVPTAGEQFEGKTATAVYTGIETDTYTGSWQSNVPQIPASYSDTSPWAAYKSTIKTITAVDKIQPKSLDFWFSNPKSWVTASAVTSADLSNIDTSKITNMSNLFTGCSNLTSLNISNWNVSNVTNMTNMFSVYSGMFRTQPACSSLTTLDLSNWDTSNVTSMSGMFNGMTHLQQVTFGSNWKWVGTNGYLPTPSSTYISGADGKWYDTDGNGYAPADIPSNKAMTYTAVAPKIAFAVYSADDNSLNFYKRAGMPSAGEQFNGKTATAVYTGIETMTSRPWRGYASNIKTATVVDDGIRPCNMNSWFYGCKSLTACDLGKLDTSNVTDMGSMFSGCSKLTSVGDLSGWNTSKVTDMRSMFSGCSSLTALDLSNWNTSNVTYMSTMFYSCSKLTSVGDLSGWSTSNVSKMGAMFSGCSSLTTLGDLSSWNTSNVTDMNSMFNGCSSLTALDLSGWNTSNVIYMGGMFSGCSSLTSADLSGWNTSNVTNMFSMFGGCKSLTACDLGKLDTSNVTDMDSMFSGCSSLTTLNLSNWNTSNVTSMLCMFQNCSKLTTLGDLSSWNTSNVTDMGSMFSVCTSLTTLGDLSSWNTSNVTDMRSMFSGCSKLSADCSNWDVSKVTSHSNFNKNATGVTVPLAWQASSDEGVEDSAIAPLCEEQENGDALSVSDENGNDKAASKTDDKASADSETEGSATTSADDVGAKEEGAPDDIAQEDSIAA